MKISALDKLEKRINNAKNYDEWKMLAIRHDELSGMGKWKEREDSNLYDSGSIRRRLERLRSLREANDNHGLLFNLNEGIHGNMGGMGQPILHAKAKFGTKRLITQYIDEIVDALEHIAQVSETEISFNEKLDFFRRASHCFGRSALMLSGGAALGYFHVGVTKTMVEEGILPDIISGSSAGSLVAGVLGTHTDEELLEAFKLDNLLTEAIEESHWLNRLLFGRNQHFNIEDLENTVARLIPDLTFQEAYERTGRHVNIPVAPAELHQTSRLLNAITSPNVYVRKAVMASCAVPGVYPPVVLSAKNAHGERQPYLPSRKWVDGSVNDDLPAKRLGRLYGVNHYIASQTNPLVLMFISDPKLEKGLTKSALRLGSKALTETVRTVSSFSKQTFSYWPRFNLFMNMYSSVLSQDYTADINIFPGYRLFNPAKLFVHLSEKQLMDLIYAGEQAIWPKVEIIRNCTKISRTLDRLLEGMEHESLNQLSNQHHKKMYRAQEMKEKVPS